MSYALYVLCTYVVCTYVYIILASMWAKTSFLLRTGVRKYQVRKSKIEGEAQIESEQSPNRGFRESEN